MTNPKFMFDRTGFPLIRVDSINAYMHWLPITKVQFEYFLCDEPSSLFDAHWYEEDILQLNPRVSAHAITLRNYWGAFLTGILPQEAKIFTTWCGSEFAIPTFKEWREAYQTLKNQSAQPKTVIDTLNEQATSVKMPQRAQQLVSQLNAVILPLFQEIGENEPSLADQMFMRMGVKEWIKSEDPRMEWGGMGQPHSRFFGGFSTPDLGRPSEPMDPENTENRQEHYGFRLLWRPK